MATINIQRTSEYNNRARDFIIYIDGQKAGTIANGETKEFTVPPGQHKVHAKIDWCSSRELSVNCDEPMAKTFSVGGFKHGKWLMPVAMGLIVLHIILKYTIQFDYVIYLIIPAFLFLLYYLTIGRKNYLSIAEVED